MTLRLKLAAVGAGLALAGAAGAAAPAFAVDFLGAPLWESYPGQYRYYYDPAPPGPRWYYDPYTNRYYRRY
jgi:hypothetical protein